MVKQVELLFSYTVHDNQIWAWVEALNWVFYSRVEFV